MNSSFNPNNQAIIYAAPTDLNNQFSTLQPRQVCARARNISRTSELGNCWEVSSLLLYAQVRKSASVHSHSSLNRVARIPFANQLAGGGQCQTVRYRATCARNSYAAALCLSPPPIPDPDYSQSDEDSGEQAKKAFKMSTLPLPGTRKCSATKITVGGGGVGGSGSNDELGAKLFNVDEIRKVRKQLRNSATFATNYTVVMGNAANEDGDNSSSGVSSDQEIAQPQSTGNEVEGGKRNSVSFASVQLPASTNGTTSESKDGKLVVLPPPDFVGNISPAAIEVLEPPPQFSDNGN